MIRLRRSVLVRIMARTFHTFQFVSKIKYSRIVGGHDSEIKPKLSLTVYLSNHIESIQKRALRIILGASYISYQDALIIFGLETLLYCRDMAGIRFIKKVTTGQIEPFYSAIIGTNNTDVNHGYGLCSGGVKAYRHVPNTKRFSEFVTSKYL